MAHNDQYGSWHAENDFQPAESGTNIINVGWNERVASAALGAFMLSSGLHTLTKNPIRGLAKTILGGFLLYRGGSGNCPFYSSVGKTKGVSQTQAINIRTSLTVNKPRTEVYNFWRKLENLPLFMKHLAAVTEIDAKHSHWEAQIPGNLGKLKWNAEIVKEESGTMIGWQSLPQSTINNAGKVTFHDALNGQGTELEVVIIYHAPAGQLGTGFAKLLNPVFEKLIRQDVMNFKDYIETKHDAKVNHVHEATTAAAAEPQAPSQGGARSQPPAGGLGNAGSNPASGKP
ncbi:SRPBCC family protein [Paraflavisolibacter sp. H34]|uniref:SRPBCC family protein n=1 Tax=Huijunlia imazamoxiresistens TaxID=3127457 RepID=UPI00301B138F